MSTPADPRREHPSMYFVQDRSNEEELTRVMIQDQMVTAGMGGVLPEQSDTTIFQKVLDVGCGTGGWLLDAARTYPSMSRLAGVDVSSKMIEYAQTQAKAQQMSDRVEFSTMDALRRLDFHEDSFDLVNQRFGASYLRTWDWPKLLYEFWRVCRPGGVARVTEFDILSESSSQVLVNLYQLGLDALYRAGHLFNQKHDGVTTELARLLRQYGFQNVQTRAYALQFRAGTPEGQSFYEDTKHLFRTLLPFFHKWIRVPENFEALYQQALAEMQQPDFVATWRMLTAWGTTPKNKEKIIPTR